MSEMLVQESSDRKPRRIRHDLRLRLLEVRAVRILTPGMVRVTLTGDLAGFASPGFDDHVKVFFPLPGENAPVMPNLGPNGIVLPEDRTSLVARDYTPRRYDPVTQVLDIDFALHDHGPATEWARQAQPGQKIGIGGPRGSFILPVNFDWHLLIGDETALPAIARRLEELPAGAVARVIAEISDKDEELVFETAASLTVQWVYRKEKETGRADGLAAALEATSLPAGSFHAWVACESSLAKSLRGQLIADHGANPDWVRASGYWRRGSTAIHDHH